MFILHPFFHLLAVFVLLGSLPDHGEAPRNRHHRQVGPHPIPEDSECSSSPRHGARLDAADKNWHLTSPTPYDPPLSYGGWLQSRALGARIISLLQSRTEADEPTSAQDQNTPNTTTFPSSSPKRKRRIIIHTSPYLRCLQTAIAISAGISQHDIDGDTSAVSHTNGATSLAADSTFTPVSTSSDTRCLLRVDAFLGEWLCPEYFEDIIPPPKSERMIAAAKAELLRHDDNTIPHADTAYKPSTGYFPGGWGNMGQTLATYPEDEVPDAQQNGNGVPVSNGDRKEGTRNRAGSYDSLQSADSPRTRRMLTKINTNLPPIPDGTYMPPTPSYAISRSAPIPAGYVAHARDACVKIDYQWDSMRDPPNWGSGGEYGEEWSTMHARFHTGLERMLSWYREQDPAARPRRHSQQPQTEDSTTLPNDADDQIETVLIIVTHGAGCNAMIGALTGEPAFVDIPTASLTMAVRRDQDDASSRAGLIGGPVAPHSRAHAQAPLQSYDLQLVASTDHLRPTVNPSASILSSPSSVTSPSNSASSRYRVASRPSISQASFIIGPSLTSGPASRGWTMARPFTAPRGSTGLWGSISSPSEAGEDIIPNFGDAWSAAAAVPPVPSHSGSASFSNGVKPEEAPGCSHLPQRTLSQRGLWGSSPLSRGAETGVKRRWTVTERRV